MKEFLVKHRSSTASARLVGFFSALAHKAARAGDAPSAVAWTSVAAEFAWGINPGFYSSRPMEELLLEIAHGLPAPAAGLLREVAGGGGGIRGFVHVVSKAYDIGGHARLIERWALKSPRAGHSLAVLGQPASALPAWLSAAIAGAGGRIFDLSAFPSLEAAALLRAICHEYADFIVDHTHPHDPTATLAFAQEGGAPVIKFNAADHVFWLGVGVADVVLDLRKSGQACSMTRRGARRSEILGIPLVAPPARSAHGVRERLGIRDSARVLLTIASSYKYRALGQWDFHELLGRILSRHESACLLAVGPAREGAWRLLCERFPGRAFALGEISGLEPIFAAADIYVDSVPFCSLTSSLDASLRGLPVHRYRNEVAPLLSNDDPAFDGAPASATIDAFVDSLSELISSPAECSRLAEAQRTEAQRVHCSPHWDLEAQSILQSLSRHRVQMPIPETGAAKAGDLAMAEFQHGAQLMSRYGIGLHEIKRSRARLALPDKARAAAKVLASYPHYATTPMIALRAAREFLRDSAWGPRAL